MDRVNRILILFFTILAFSLGGVIHLIQTEKFAQVISKKIKRRAMRELGINLAFRRIEVKMFPPATLLKDVEVEYNKSGRSLSVFSEEVGLYFSIFDFFSRRLQVDTLKLSSVELDFKSKTDDDVKNNYDDLFKEYINFIKDSSFIVKNLELVNFDGYINNSLLGIDSLKASLFKEMIQLKGIVNLFEDTAIPAQLRDIDLDSLTLDILLREQSIDIRNINLVTGMDKINLMGNVKSPGREPILDIDVKARVGIRSLANKIGYRQYIDEYPVDGHVDLEVFLDGSFQKPRISLSSELNLIDSEYAQIDKVDLALSEKEGVIWLESLKAFKRGAVVRLVNKVPLYDIEKNKIQSNEATFEVEKIHTNDALYVLRQYLDILKGYMSGSVTVGWNKKGIYFKPFKGFKIEDLKLYSPDYKNLILKNNGFSIIRSSMLLTYDLDFNFNAELKIGNSTAIGEGVFNENNMKVIVYESNLNLEDIGPIVGVPLLGKGKLKGFIGGDYDDVRFSFLPDLETFEVLNYHLGKISGKVDFRVKDLSLNVKEAQARFGSTEYGGNASFLFEKDQFELDLNIRKGTYGDAVVMIPEVIKLYTRDQIDMHFNFSGPFKYKSTFSIDGLEIETKLRGENLTYLGERLDNFYVDAKVSNGNVKFSKIEARKSKGFLDLSGDLNYKTKRFKYKGDLGGIQLIDFEAYNTMNLGLNGTLRGEFYGEGNFDHFTSRTQIKLGDAEIANRSVKDSILTVYNKGSDLFVSSNLFEGVSITEGYLSFDKKIRRKSYLNSRLYTNEPALLAGVLSEHNYANQVLRGSLDIRSEFSFYVDDIEKFDFDFFVPEFDLQYMDQLISVDNKRNKVLVKSGKIESWDLLIHTSDGFFESKGNGDVAKSFQIDSRFKLNPLYLKLVTPKIISSTGSIIGTSILLREKDKFSFHSETTGKNIDIKIDKVPGAIRNINFRLLSEGKDALLESLSGSYGKGTINADGNIKFKLPFPLVNLNGSVNGAQVPVTERTFGVISGNANLRGDKLPYLLSGGVSILHGEVLNEFEDFSKMIGLSEGYLRYIPNAGTLNRMNLINYDLDIDIFNPISVKNSISDLKIEGGLKVKGPVQKPLLTGDLSIVPNVSRVFFKGNEFILSEGQLSFLDLNKREVPEIKIAGVASVDRYEVGLEVDGRVDKFGIKLSSTPSLDQGQILSLLVLGVPDDINKELDDAEREQIAVQGGVGLIVERFKLVKPIDSMLGLKFSVSPEFQEDDSSLLEGRLSSGDSGSSRYKSGTKLKVQKKIADKVDVSFSSTVGGTVEETKEMNINYNINKNLSLEGVYELRSLEEETEENPESVGADIKWKFSF